MAAESDMVIIGAGPAGLAAALEATRLGGTATVLEAADCVGGICRTVARDGFRFDLGGHRFFTKNAEVRALWQEVLGEQFVTRSRLSRVYYRQRFFAYPIRLGDAVRGLGLLETLLIGLSYMRRRVFPHRDCTHFANWVANQFGDRLYRHFFKVYTEKVWGIPCERMAAEWGAQRIKGLSLWSALTSALSVRRRRGITSLIEAFEYPRLGCGQMYDAMAERVRSAGIPILLRHRVCGLERSSDRVTAVVAETPDGERRFPCRQVISSMPLDDLVLGMRPALSDAAQAAARGLTYRHLITVNLILRRPSELPDTWLYIHEPGVRMGRLQVFPNWSPAMVPEPSAGSLGCEYFASDGDELWEMPEAALCELAVREATALGVTSPDAVVEAFAVRVPQAYPVIDLEAPARARVLHEALANVSNLHPVGRNGMFRYNNMDHSILTGMLAARCILKGGTWDTWQVNTEDEYLEEVRDA